MPDKLPPSAPPNIDPGAPEWPFTGARLTAGLRRHRDDLSLKVLQVSPLRLPFRLPSIGEIRGLSVTFEGQAGQGSISLVLKEPRGTTRTGLAGAGRREVGFYRSLAAQVPLRTPDLVAYSELGDWLVLEYVEPKYAPKDWRAQDYLAAIAGLADLHNRFWNLRGDLGTFAWLSDPLEGDFDVHMASIDQAMERLTSGTQEQPVTGSEARVRLLKHLAQNAERVVGPLREHPATLLHGDYWPGNISVLGGERQVVYDWQLAGIGPSIIDLLVFLTKSQWWYRPLPLGEETLINHYRALLSEQGGQSWNNSDWDLLWDHALMWSFLQEWLDLLAISPDAILSVRAEQLDQIWLSPVEQAADRRLA